MSFTVWAEAAEMVLKRHCAPNSRQTQLGYVHTVSLIIQFGFIAHMRFFFSWGGGVFTLYFKCGQYQIPVRTGQGPELTHMHKKVLTFNWSTGCYFCMEVPVDAELELVELWCEWLHWKRFNPRFQDVKPIHAPQMMNSFFILGSGCPLIQLAVCR